MKSKLVRAVALICCASILSAQPATPQQLREKAVTIPIGSVVEAKLVNKGGKVKGQLLSVSEDGVTLRTAEGGTVKERAVAFSEMKQLSDKKGTGTAVKIFAGVGIAFTALIIIGFALAAGS